MTHDDFEGGIGDDAGATPDEPAHTSEPTATDDNVDDADQRVDVDEVEVDDGAGDALAAEISNEIDALAAERDEYKDIAQRLQADFENFRKRAIAQQQAEVERAQAQMAASLLPVLDATEAAYVGHPDEIGPLLNLLIGELRKVGLEPMELLDTEFDPNLAEAVAHEPGDGDSVVVAEVMRSGYTWKGKTLRAAMVRTRG